jgi:cytochrome c-type biogenesis protein CcmH/NrfG
VLIGDGERTAGESALRTALSLEPDDVAALIEHADRFRRLGLYGDARRAFERALSASPGDGRAARGLAEIREIEARRRAAKPGSESRAE